MNSENNIIKTADIKQVANNIDKKRDEIYNVYKESILTILNNSQDILKVSGLTYDELIASFNELFTNLDNQLSGLVRFLTNNVITSYEKSSDAIARNFNQKLADQVSKAMAAMRGK